MVIQLKLQSPAAIPPALAVGEAGFLLRKSGISRTLCKSFWLPKVNASID